MSQEGLTHDTFARLRGDIFTARLADAVTVPLQVVEVAMRPGMGEAGGAFSVEFQGPIEPALQQRTYELQHEILGTHAIFLVPIARATEGYLYEAVFTTLDGAGR